MIWRDEQEPAASLLCGAVGGSCCVLAQTRDESCCCVWMGPCCSLPAAWRRAGAWRVAGRARITCSRAPLFSQGHLHDDDALQAPQHAAPGRTPMPARLEHERGWRAPGGACTNAPKHAAEAEHHMAFYEASACSCSGNGRPRRRLRRGAAQKDGDTEQRRVPSSPALSGLQPSSGTGKHVCPASSAAQTTRPQGTHHSTPRSTCCSVRRVLFCVPIPSAHAHVTLGLGGTPLGSLIMISPVRMTFGCLSAPPTRPAAIPPPPRPQRSGLSQRPVALERAQTGPVPARAARERWACGSMSKAHTTCCSSARRAKRPRKSSAAQDAVSVWCCGAHS